VADERVTVPIVGVHHVVLLIDDLAAARQFYGDVLGLTEIDRPDFKLDGAWFQLGAGQLHLIVEAGSCRTGESALRGGGQRP
jgi:catechol 2,3-dioxygenase-like lactoylglutathione lyase family enzyme